MWEPYENIVDNNLIRDYEERQCEAEEAAAAEATALQLPAEPEPVETVAEAEPAAETEAEVVVDPTAAAAATPTKILKLQYYANKAGGLACLWVQLQYSDQQRQQHFSTAAEVSSSNRE